MDSETKEESEEAYLSKASELIEALISSTYDTKIFPVKWRLIRGKVEQLRSALTASADSTHSAKSIELTTRIRTVISILCEAQLLANKCSNESFGGGKLLLKSDVEIVTSKIELQLQILHETPVSGTLAHSKAIILSKPEAGASREYMKFYLKSLTGRLKIFDSQMRVGALRALNDALHEDERYAKIMVAEISDGVSLLLKLLEVGDLSVQEEASESICIIAAFDSSRGVLVAAGVIAQLIRVLQQGSEPARVRAARALKRLTENSDNAWSASAQGGVSTLLDICNGDVGSSGELIQTACSILRSLSDVDEIKRFMVEKGAVSVMARLLRWKEESFKIQAIELLTSLATDEEITHLVVKEDVVGSLVHVLDPSSPHSPKAREVALRAIERLSFSSPTSINHLMSSGYFLEHVLYLLRNGEISIQESALKAVSRLCGLCEASKKAVGDAGFMPELVKLLEAKSFQVREIAAEALCGLMSIQRNKRRFIQEEQNVNRILRLLNPEEEKSVTRKFLLSAVASLTDSKSVRRKIMASGRIKYLEKLAETEGTDAKKIVKKLSGNRVWGVITGIWGSGPHR